MRMSDGTMISVMSVPEAAMPSIKNNVLPTSATGSATQMDIGSGVIMETKTKVGIIIASKGSAMHNAVINLRVFALGSLYLSSGG